MGPRPDVRSLIRQGRDWIHLGRPSGGNDARYEPRGGQGHSRGSHHPEIRGLDPEQQGLKEAGESLTVYGDGEQTRAYTHVSDVVRATVLAAEVAIPEGQNTILNIGSARETSVREIAERIAGDVTHIWPNPRGEFEEQRKRADYSKAKALLGWEPSVTLERGLGELLDS